MFLNVLSVKIMSTMDERKLTLEESSRKTGLSRRFLNNVINGTQAPSINSLEKICSALELEPNELLISEKSKDAQHSIPMCVNTLYCSNPKKISTYSPVCPRCNTLLQNDWQSYCHECGQRLSWKNFLDSKTILRKPDKKTNLRTEKICK